MLAGPRLILRELSEADAPALLAVFGDPEVMRFWSSPPMASIDEASALVERIRRLFEQRQLFQWGICRRAAGPVLGTCTLFNLNTPHRRAEIGFALAREAWGQGLGTEAVGMLIRFTLDTLALHRLEADVDPENVRSLRLLERQGFRREGHLRERWHHLGKLHDTILLGLLTQEWRPPGVGIERDPDLTR